MSAPKYLTQRADSTMSIVVKAESLTSYIFRITTSEKQFPKAYRYTLISQLRNECLDLMKAVYNGCSKRGVSSKDFAIIRKFQEMAYTNLINIKSLLVISQDLAHMHNPKYIAELYDDTVDSFNHWVKNTKRSEKKALWKESLSEDERFEFKMKMLSKKARKMKRDEDGFVVLIPHVDNESANE